MRTKLLVVFLSLSLIVVFGIVLRLHSAPAENKKQTVRYLDEFGDVSTEKAAAQTLEKATKEMTKQGGGILVIPADAPPRFNVVNNTQTEELGPGVTIIDYRKGHVVYHLPGAGTRSPTGFAPFQLRRDLNLGENSLSPHGTYSVQRIQNNIISGSTSYAAHLWEPATRGDNARCYVTSIPGIVVGQQLNISGIPNVMKEAEKVRVKSIGWDPGKKKHYFTADLKRDHPLKA